MSHLVRGDLISLMITSSRLHRSGFACLPCSRGENSAAHSPLEGAYVSQAHALLLPFHTRRFFLGFHSVRSQHLPLLVKWSSVSGLDPVTFHRRDTQPSPCTPQYGSYAKLTHNSDNGISRTAAATERMGWSIWSSASSQNASGSGRVLHQFSDI